MEMLRKKIPKKEVDLLSLLSKMSVPIAKKETEV